MATLSEYYDIVEPLNPLYANKYDIPEYDKIKVKKNFLVDLYDKTVLKYPLDMAHEQAMHYIYYLKSGEPFTISPDGKLYKSLVGVGGSQLTPNQYFILKKPKKSIGLKSKLLKK